MNRRKTILKRRFLALYALLLACPVIAKAQTRLTSQVFGGFSYVRTDDDPNVNGFGWETTYSEYPYTSRRWIGGAIEANGLYATPLVKVDGQVVSGLLQNQIYTFLGGPTVRAQSFHHYEPFAHVLLGALLTNIDTTGKGAAFFGKAFAQSRTAFGLAVGGGMDHPISRKLAVRGNVDWLRSNYKDQDLDRQNSLRISVGVVAKF